MAVFRVERNTGYTVMSNHHLRNKELSLKAKGLLSQMLSLPEDWDYTLAGLSHINREKIDAIREAVKELEKAGYIVRSRERDEKGRLRGADYVIYEQPQPREPEAATSVGQPPILDLPTLENPTLDNPTLEKPTLDYPTQLNKDISSKEQSITDLSSTHSFPFHSLNPLPFEQGEAAAPPERKRTEAKSNSAVEIYREIIKDNIEYDHLIQNCKIDKDRLDEIVDLMLETVCTARKTIRIAGDDYPAELVKSKFLKLNSSHIEFVLDCMRENTTKVRNIKQYLKAVLFNAPSTIDSYSKYVSSVKKHQGVSIDGVLLPFEDTYDFDDNKEEFLRLRREIAFLTKTRREIVYAYYYENESIARISKQRGIPIGTVKWHLNQARHELKEGFVMERKIGKLGLKPIKATGIGHSGNPGPNGGPEFYLNDSLNLNIVYSVYYTSRTKEEIAEELGVIPVFIEDKIDLLESNGFLVRKAGNKFTTYVKFDSPTYSLEKQENKLKKQLEIAQLLAKDYTPSVRQAISDIHEAYIPSGNRELLEAAAIFYGVANKCQLNVKKDLSPYYIKTTDGGDYIAFIETERTQVDKDYVPTLQLPSMRTCGNMTRYSEKYPVYSWSIDSRYSSRKGGWKNNWTSDYEYLYEFMTGTIADDLVNAHKFKRLRERQFISENNQINIMVVKGKAEDFFDKIPELDEKFKKQFADYAFEYAQTIARDYPPQMRDLIFSWTAEGFIGNEVALMVMDILYTNGTFHALTDREKITSNLILFTDMLPLDVNKENV